MKILVVTPKLPYPATGADEQDRFEGMRLLKDAGHELAVLARTLPHQKQEDIDSLSRALGTPVRAVPYPEAGFALERLANPLWLDGAAFAWNRSDVRSAFIELLEQHRPDAVWFDYVGMWPLFALARKYNARVITRSANIESRHFLDEQGITPWTMLKYLAKEAGERITARGSDAICAITPREAEGYRVRGAGNALVLPLRNLPGILEEEPAAYREKQTLDVVFSGSTYSVAHNLKAAQFVIEDIAPRIERMAPGAFRFHITGSKLPERLQKLPGNAIYEGYVPDYGAFMRSIDVALAPSITGEGMQQKAFEPLARGIPTITSPRALAGYPFKEDEAVLLAQDADAAVAALMRLRDVAERERIGTEARRVAQDLFSRDRIMQTLRAALSR